MKDDASAVMTTPPSDAFRIVEVPDPFKELAARRGAEGTFVGMDEAESPWIPFGDNAAIRHLAFDVRNNIFSNVLWIKKPGVIGTHYHRGQIVMLCLEGSARYLEYDWVATPGASSRKRRARRTPWSPIIPRARNSSAGCRARSTSTMKTQTSRSPRMSGGS